MQRYNYEQKSKDINDWRSVRTTQNGTRKVSSVQIIRSITSPQDFVKIDFGIIMPIYIDVAASRLVYLITV